MKVAVELDAAREFLTYRRLAVVGASADPKGFGSTIYRALRDHGYDAIPVNPNAETVFGDRCYPDVGDVPGDLDGVIVMVHRDKARAVVESCIARGVPRVWLFKGLGGASAVDDGAVELCREHGVDVVPGACPLMFLEPVGWFHKVHRSARQMRRSLV